MAKDKILEQQVADAGAELGRATIFYHDVVAKKFGLNPTDIKCMRFILKSETPIIAGDLAEHTGLTTGAITGILDRLEKAKMIKRHKDKNDRRKVFIEPNNEMARELVQMKASFSKQVMKVIRSFSDEQLKVILKYKFLITEILEEETKSIS